MKEKIQTRKYMDFLDPRRKRAHRRRLMLGYVLMAILVGIGTMTLLYLSYGYDVDRKTGQVIQNGIVFVDSQPRGAAVYLNDVRQQNNTDTRLDIPAGVYTVRLELDGYRNWQRTFSINGGQFQRLVYPLLIPNILQTRDVQTYDVLPKLTTQSPDRKWLFVQRPTTNYQFDVFDLGNPEDAPTLFQVPLDILTNPTSNATLEAIEWSTDNRHVLVKRSYEKNKTEFIVLDRERPDESININTLLGINPAKISLKNKRPDQFYYLDKLPGTLRIANTKDRTLSAPLELSVHEYSTHGDDLVMLATSQETETKKISIKILENNDSYTLRVVSESQKYLLDISKYDNRWYYVAGSSSDGLTYVYEDPLKSLKDKNNSTPLSVVSIIRTDNPRFVGFSANTQFISVQSANKFVALDLEENKQYQTVIEQEIELDQKLKWMDGHRFIYVVNGQSYVIDFDGSNENTLVTSLGDYPYFDRDYENVFTLEGSKSDPSKEALTITALNLNQ